MSVKLHACVCSISINMQSQVNVRLCLFRHVACAQVCVCGYVSMSVEAACLECVHTCSQMNEAEGSELSCDSGSCQHCGVCDVWAHPSLPAPFCGGGGTVLPTSFPILPSVNFHLELYLSCIVPC